MKVNVRQLFRRAWSSLPSIRKNGPDIGNTVVSSGREVEDTKTTFVLNDNPVSPVPSVVLPSIDPISRKIQEVPFLSPYLPAWEVIPDVRSAATSISLEDDLTCPIEINLESLPGLRKRIFGFNRPVAFTSKSSKESAVTMYTERALDEIGYPDSPFFYQGIDTDFNFDYLKDLQEVSAKRGARIKLFGLEEDINKYPRYLVAFCNKLAKAGRELFRHRFGELAHQHKIEDIELLKFLMTRSGLYSQGNNSPYRRAKELAKEIDRMDELVASGQKQFWQMRKNIKAGIKSSTPDRDDEILALSEWLDDPQKREENAKVIYALQMLAGKEGASAVPKEEDEPPRGELVEIYADEMPNNFSRILDTVEAECRNCFLEMLDNRFDVLTQAANFSEPTTQEPDGKGDEAPEEIAVTSASSPSQATCDFVVTEESPGAEQVAGTESANLTGTPKTTEVEMTVSDVLGLAKDSTIDIVREAFRRECVWITTREKQLVDEYNRALAEAQLREELETEAEKGRSVIWRREFLKWGGAAAVGVTGLGWIGWGVKTYFDKEAMLKLERDGILGAKIDSYTNVWGHYLNSAEEEFNKYKTGDPDSDYNKVLGLYFESDPPEEILRAEIEYFLKERANKIIPVDERMVRFLKGYLESPGISVREFGDRLLEFKVAGLKDAEVESFKNSLPMVVRAPGIVSAIKKGKIILPSGIPEVLLAPGAVPDDFRSKFQPHLWFRIEYQIANMDPKPAYPSSGQVVGVGILMQPSNSILYGIINAKDGYFPLYYYPTYQNIVRRSYELMKTEAERVKEEYLREYKDGNKKRLERLVELREKINNGENTQADDIEAESIIAYLDNTRKEIEPVISGAARIIYRIDRLVDNEKQQGLLDININRLREEVRNNPELKKNLGL